MINAVGASPYSSASYNTAASQAMSNTNKPSAQSTTNTRGAADMAMANDGNMAAGIPESELAHSSQVLNYNTEREALNILV